MPEQPYMKLYVSDYLGDTQHLSAEQHGAYMLLLMTMWQVGPLPTEDAKLARIARVDRRRWARISPDILAFFHVGEDGKLHQKRLDQERKIARQIRAKRTTASKARWSRNSLENQGQADANGYPNGMHYARVPDPDIDSSLRSESSSPSPPGSGDARGGGSRKGEKPERAPGADRALAAKAKREAVAADAVSTYNAAAAECGWTVCAKLTPKRRSALLARLDEVKGIDGWQAVVNRASTSAFLRGAGGSWKPDFDWFIRPDTPVKIMEGRYDDARRSARPTDPMADRAAERLRVVAAGFAQVARERGGGGAAVPPADDLEGDDVL